MPNELVPTKAGGVMTLPQLKTLDDYLKLGEVLGKSGMFNDARDAAKAVVKMLAGAELGFSPLASMVDIHMIEGKPSIGAHLRAASIRRSERYDYDVMRLDAQECALAFYERALPTGGETRKGTGGWVRRGEVRLTIAEAEQRGMTISEKGNVKKNWKSSPDDMLFARCISKGYRRFTPDLTGGLLTYDADELDTAEAPLDAEFTVAGPAPEANGTAPPPAAQGAAVRQGPAVSQPPPPAAPPGPGAAPPAERKISEQQCAELSQLIRDAGVPAQTLLDRYQVKGIVHLPEAHFLDAKNWLAGQKKPAGNGVQQAPGFITREQFDELYKLLQPVPTFAMTLLHVFGLERWSLLPQHLHPLAMAIAGAKDFDLNTWQREKLGGRTILQLNDAERQNVLRELTSAVPAGA